MPEGTGYKGRTPRRKRRGPSYARGKALNDGIKKAASAVKKYFFRNAGKMDEMSRTTLDRNVKMISEKYGSVDKYLDIVADEKKRRIRK